jgi:hypothetical protein
VTSLRRGYSESFRERAAWQASEERDIVAVLVPSTGLANISARCGERLSTQRVSITFPVFAIRNLLLPHAFAVFDDQVDALQKIDVLKHVAA